MDDAYDDALRTIADVYDVEYASHGGRSLSRVATVVVSSGAFFQRLREGKPFLVHNLERFAAYFRDPAHWPDHAIPDAAVAALVSMGRPPLPSSMTHPCGTAAAHVACDRSPVSQEAR